MPEYGVDGDIEEVDGRFVVKVYGKEFYLDEMLEGLRRAEKARAESVKNQTLREKAEIKQEKIEIEKNIQELNKRCSELDVLIKSKQEELDYKKEVEVTTDKLKTYIRDLEVKPGAVRDALAALINNMNN